MDVSTIIRTVQRQVGDDGNVVFDNPDDYIDWINEAQLEIARETECLIGSSTAAASTFPVAYPSDFIKVKRLTYGGVSLDFVNIEDLDAKKLSVSEQDVPVFFYFVNNTIALFPDPTASDSTSVVFLYAKTPVIIDDINDALTIPTHMHTDVVKWCLMRAFTRVENYRAAEASQAAFEKGVAKRIDPTEDSVDSYPVIRDDPWEMW